MVAERKPVEEVKGRIEFIGDSLPPLLDGRHTRIDSAGIKNAIAALLSSRSRTKATDTAMDFLLQLKSGPRANAVIGLMDGMGRVQTVMADLADSVGLEDTAGKIRDVKTHEARIRVGVSHGERYAHILVANTDKGLDLRVLGPDDKPVMGRTLTEQIKATGEHKKSARDLEVYLQSAIAHNGALLRTYFVELVVEIVESNPDLTPHLPKDLMALVAQKTKHS